MAHPIGTPRHTAFVPVLDDLAQARRCELWWRTRRESLESAERTRRAIESASVSPMVAAFALMSEQRRAHAALYRLSESDTRRALSTVYALMSESV